MIAAIAGRNLIVGSEPFPLDDRATRRDRALLVLSREGDRVPDAPGRRRFMAPAYLSEPALPPMKEAYDDQTCGRK